MTVEEFLEGSPDWDQLLGVHERRRIAGAPNLILRDERTVSVVTRYWGEPPPLGRTMHGDSSVLGSTSCGNGAGQVGDLVVSSRARRSIGGQRIAGRTLEVLTSADEALLTEAFGPPVVIQVDGRTRMAAHAQLWMDPALFVIVVAGVGITATRWIRGRVDKDSNPEPE